MPPSDLSTLHCHSDDIPWIEFIEGTAIRILHARPSEDLIVSQVRAQPGTESELHRHLGPVFGWTNSGRWGHDRTYEYRPGTYIFEPPGVIHKFHAADEPVDAIYVSYGALEIINPKTLEVERTITPASILQNYLDACERAGLPRPNIPS